MKRLFGWIVAIVASATMLVGCGGNGYADAVSQNAIIVARVNGYQLFEKSKALQDLVNVTKQQGLTEGMPQTLTSVVNDPENLGIDYTAPVYAYVELTDLEKTDGYVVCVAKVADKVKLDNIINMVTPLMGNNCIKSTVDDATFVELGRNDGIIAYNNTAILLGGASRHNSANNFMLKQHLSDALKRATNGNGGYLPKFEDSDVALCINMESIINNPQFSSMISREAQLADLGNTLEQLREMKIDFALNFADGSIDLESLVTGAPKAAAELDRCSNDNLQYVAANAWAVFNINLNGNKIVEALKSVVEEDPATKMLLDQAIKEATGMMNFNTVMTMVEPLINTIDGDITAALTGIEHNEYDEIPVACAMMTVKDNTIFDYLSPICETTYSVQKTSPNTYQFTEDGVTCYLGTSNDLLYLSTQKPLAECVNPATNAAWYPDVKKSYGYFVVNIDEILKNPYIRGEFNEVLRWEFGSDERFLVEQLCNSVSHIVCTFPSNESVKLSLVFKNREINALQQIVDIAKYEVLKNINL